MGKKKKKRDHRTSSGGRKVARINQSIRKLLCKIRRWNRYKDEIEQHARQGDASRWDTSGLEKHVGFLEELL